MSWLLRIVLVMACVGPVFVPATAAADRQSKEQKQQERSRVHFQRGETAFALGNFEAALKYYELAYEAFSYPLLLLNIGQCHRNLKAYDRAIFSFRKYLGLAPKSKHQGKVQRYIRELESERDAAAAAARGINAQAAPTPARLATTEPKTSITVTPLPLHKKWWFVAGVSIVVSAAATGAAIHYWPSGGCSTELCLDFDR